MFFKEQQERPCIAIHNLDADTVFNMCGRCGTKQPYDIVKTSKRIGLSWAKWPDRRVVGKGSACGADPLEMIGSLGSQQSDVPFAATFWQLGMVERHGPEFSDIVRARTRETTVVGQYQMRYVLMYAALAETQKTR